MPVKNNLLIYKEVYRKSVLWHGMFHQLRVDGGKEFYLSLSMQEEFQHLRNNIILSFHIGNISIQYRQTQSKQNLPIERFWPEVNAKVNYPIKVVLVKMDNDDVIDMENDLEKFCVSEITCQVARIGLQRLVGSWNNHRIPGRGVPLKIMQSTNRLQRIASNNFPEEQEAKDLYEYLHDGRLTQFPKFGHDPFDGNMVTYAARRDRFS